MNYKLLKELSKQAETEVGWSEEKFCELIVKECTKMVRSGSLPDVYSEPCLQVIADDIEDYFGVNQ